MKECYTCEFNDSDYGCNCPHYDKWYSCPIENKKPENIQAIKEYAEWMAQHEGKWVAESEYKRCKDECKKEAEDKGIVMSDEKCKPCEYLYVCPYMMAEMNDIVEGN